MCTHKEHDNIVALGSAHAQFPRPILRGKSVVIQYRGCGCVTWKELDSDRGR